MNTRIQLAAQKQLAASMTKIEVDRGKQLTPAARIMLEAILMEALTTRESDWLTRAGIHFEAHGSETRITAKLKESFDGLLNQAWIEQSGDFITTRDILAAVNKRWCNIFPIC